MPPFSKFLLAFLDVHHINLIHLAPNSILHLSIFSHFCETFVRVLPSVALWSHYFIQYAMSQCIPDVLGSCYFRLRDHHKAEYLPYQFRSKWDDWENSWYYIEANVVRSIRIPPAKANLWEDWQAASLEEHKLTSVCACMCFLCSKGLTASMVVPDFVRHRLAPL